MTTWRTLTRGSRLPAPMSRRIRTWLRSVIKLSESSSPQTVKKTSKKAAQNRVRKRKGSPALRRRVANQLSSKRRKNRKELLLLNQMSLLRRFQRRRPSPCLSPMTMMSRWMGTVATRMNYLLCLSKLSLPNQFWRTPHRPRSIIRTRAASQMSLSLRNLRKSSKEGVARVLRAVVRRYLRRVWSRLASCENVSTLRRLTMMMTTTKLLKSLLKLKHLQGSLRLRSPHRKRIHKKTRILTTVTRMSRKTQVAWIASVNVIWKPLKRLCLMKNTTKGTPKTETTSLVMPLAKLWRTFMVRPMLIWMHSKSYWKSWTGSTGALRTNLGSS